MGRDVTKLHPRLQGVIAQLKQEFPTLLITDAFRSVAEQNALYAKGRTAPGGIVTYVTGTSYGSQHQWGIAFDFANNERGNLYPAAFMNAVGARAKRLGCGWGGDWANFVDKPHVYLKDWGSTTTPLKNAYGNPSNFISTWDKNESVTKKGWILMYRFYRNETEGTIHWFDGSSTHPLAHPDEMVIVNDVYREATQIFTGTPRDVPSYTYKKDAPWDIRLKGAAQRHAEIEEVKGMITEVKEMIKGLS